jgi:Asp-tRNA(Asn)/Glu-tRNA(Gln) amidotransferase B subunit
MSDFMDDEKDIDKLREVLSVVSTEIPKILDAISKTIYSPENAERLGEQTAAFYKKLKEAGMNDEQAAKLTEAFMANFSIGKVVEQIIGPLGHSRGDDDDEIEKMVRERVKKKIKKSLGDDDD